MASVVDKYDGDKFIKIMHKNHDGFLVLCNKMPFKGADGKDFYQYWQKAPMRYSFKRELSLKGSCYVSVNGFASRSRFKQKAKWLNAFFIDIDLFHKEQYDETRLQTAIKEIEDAIKGTPLEKYTMKVYSGRGIAFYFVFKAPLLVSDVTKMFWEMAYQKLFEAFHYVLRDVLEKYNKEEQCVEIDSSVVGDMSRICRIPGTLNLNSGTIATFEEYNEEYQYELNDMILLLSPANFGLEKWNGTKREKETQKEKETFEVDYNFEDVETDLGEMLPGVFCEKINQTTRDNARSLERVIRKLVSIRSMVEGDYRHNIVLYHYNCCKVLSGLDKEYAMAHAFALNQAFREPLSRKEMLELFASVDTQKQGYYNFAMRSTIARKMNMTQYEIEQTGILRNEKKQQVKKQNKEKRKQDILAIEKLLKQGKTYAEIQRITGRSSSFVAMVSKSLRSSFLNSSHFAKEQYSSIGEPYQGKERVQYGQEKEQKKEEKEIEKKGTKKEKVLEEAYKYSLSDVEQEEELKNALDLMLSGRNVYLSGNGGTGKSLVTRAFVQKMKEMGKKVMVAAPSGLAAFSIGGTTVHAMLKMDAERVYRKEDKPSGRSIDALRGVSCVVVDECGMLRMDHFIYLVRCIEEIRKKERRNIQLVMVGDFLQIAPVVTDKEREALERYYGKKVFFQAFEEENTWKKLKFCNVRLTKNRRQMNKEFASMMDLARVGDPSVLRYFSQFERESDYYLEDGYVHLCAYRKDVNDINSNIVSRHKQDKSYREFEAEVKDGELCAKYEYLKTLAFYDGMPVMAVKNTDRGFKNGSMGVVTKVCKNTVVVKFLGSDNPVRVGKVKQYKDGVEFKQIPLVPAYAVTVHKCQSQTFEKVVVHQGMFEEGQAYVALSRVKSPEGLVVCGHLKTEEIERPILKSLANASEEFRQMLA